MVLFVLGGDGFDHLDDHGVALDDPGGSSTLFFKDFLHMSKLIFVFDEFLALFFCLFTHIYNENAMLFSALCVAFPFFQHLCGNIAYFTFFRLKYQKCTRIIRFFVPFDARFLIDLLNDCFTEFFFARIDRKGIISGII